MMKKSKGIIRFGMISNGAIFQFFNAFSTAIIAFFVFAKDNVAIWGQFAVIWLVVSWLTMLFNFGSKDFLLKEFTKSHVKPKELCLQNMVGRLPLLGLSIVLMLCINQSMQSLILVPLLVATYIINGVQPLFIFEKRFKLLLLTEMAAIGLQLIFIFSIVGNFNLNGILVSFLIYYIVKLVVIAFVFRGNFKQKWFNKNEISFLKPLWPFFLLTLGGMLVNKSDFIIVATYLSDSSKAQYQIISTFSTMGIIVAHALIQPFIKQIYRINLNSFYQIYIKYFFAGIVLSLLFTCFVYLMTSYFFNFQLSFISLILLYCIELIFFAINPLVFYLFRNDKQHYMVVIVLVSGLLSLVFAGLFVQPFGIEGALLSNFIGNCIFFILLFIKRKKIALASGFALNLIKG